MFQYHDISRRHIKIANLMSLKNNPNIDMLIDIK